ncbi:MAG TPA: outer membrane protein transport protein [Gammaproteobacteria bacterium]
MRITIMSSGIKKSLIALSVSGALIAPSAYATNGYFAHGYSTAEKGLAGAGVAYSQDALSSATNPAGLVKVGERLDVGGAIFNPNRKYTASMPSGAATIGNTGFPAFPLTPGTYESSHDYFFIPHIAYNWMLDDTTAFGIAAYGNGGMNTDYQTVQNPNNTTGTFGGGNAGINLSQLFINASYAKQIDDKNAVGASLIVAYQMFKAHGLGAFGQLGFSNDPANLTDNGDDTSYGYGVKLGWQGDVTPDVTLGVSYQSKMSMSEFDDYAGLFAEQGGFDIPATAIIGLAWKTSDRSTLVADIQQIYYSDVASIGNDGVNNLFACGMAGGAPNASCLGGSNGAGFGYDDMTVIKLGYEWQQNDMTWRVGVSNGDQPISDKETMLNILAPAVMETHLTFGFTMPISANSEFTFAGMYAPSNSVEGPTQFDNTQTVKLEMDQFELQGTYTMKF